MNYLISFAAAVVIILFILTACKDSFGENDIKVEDFVTSLQNDSTAVVLDVRNPAELTGPLGMIEGVVNIPSGKLNKRIEELEKYKDRTIFVICRSGSRSKTATNFLLEQNFKAKNVWGGMRAYRTHSN